MVTIPLRIAVMRASHSLHIAFVVIYYYSTGIDICATSIEISLFSAAGVVKIAEGAVGEFDSIFRN